MNKDKIKTSIFKDLNLLKLTSVSTRKLFSKRTRDIDGLKVWKDSLSGIIYIDDFYVGNEIYIDGSYREEEKTILNTASSDFEREMDVNRRFESNLTLIAGKKILDFGCGSGDLLRLAKPHCKNVIGVELQQSYVDALNSEDIKCVNSLDKVENSSIETCISFHVIEHLPNPLEILTEIKSKLVNGGTLVIEVPHANDFLLSFLQNEKFKMFTLWSQHLVLHTSESLHRMLEYVGFNEIIIKGVQRYPLSNHINWLANGKPGGHKSSISIIDSPALKDAYEKSLIRINATDTLVATAKV